MTDEALPIILTRSQVLALLVHNELEIRIAARPRGPASLPDCTLEGLERRYPLGRRLWVREIFSTRRDGDQLKIAYPWSGPGPQSRLFPAGQVEAKYLTDRYVTRPAKYMPRWAARILLEVTAIAPDTHPGRDALIIHTRPCPPTETAVSNPPASSSAALTNQRTTEERRDAF